MVHFPYMAEKVGADPTWLFRDHRISSAAHLPFWHFSKLGADEGHRTPMRLIALRFECSSYTSSDTSAKHGREGGNRTHTPEGTGF